MKSPLSWFRTILGRLLDDALPVNPEEARERDWTGETSREEAERRQLEFDMEMLEKRGKGGYR